MVCPTSFAVPKSASRTEKGNAVFLLSQQAIASTSSRKAHRAEETNTVPWNGARSIIQCALGVVGVARIDVRQAECAQTLIRGRSVVAPSPAHAARGHYRS
jgi:hypothetical protein